MSSTRYNFHSDCQWNGSGDFPAVLTSMKPLKEWIKKFSSEINKLEKMYFTFIGNDGKLVGVEKGQLIGQLNRILGGLILFHRYVEEEKTPGFTSISCGKSYHYTISIHGNTWKGEGTLGRRSSYDVSSFAAWYRAFCGGIRELLQLYGQCLEDRIVEPHEVRKLHEKTEFMIYQILSIQRELHSGPILT